MFARQVNQGPMWDRYLFYICVTYFIINWSINNAIWRLYDFEYDADIERMLLHDRDLQMKAMEKLPFLAPRYDDTTYKRFKWTPSGGVSDVFANVWDHEISRTLYAVSRFRTGNLIDKPKIDHPLVDLAQRCVWYMYSHDAREEAKLRRVEIAHVCRGPGALGKSFLPEHNSVQLMTSFSALLFASFWVYVLVLGSLVFADNVIEPWLNRARMWFYSSLDEEVQRFAENLLAIGYVLYRVVFEAFVKIRNLWRPYMHQAELDAIYNRHRDAEIQAVTQYEEQPRAVFDPPRNPPPVNVPCRTVQRRVEDPESKETFDIEISTALLALIGGDDDNILVNLMNKFYGAGDAGDGIPEDERGVCVLCYSTDDVNKPEVVLHEGMTQVMHEKCLYDWFERRRLQLDCPHCRERDVTYYVLNKDTLHMYARNYVYSAETQRVYRRDVQL